MFMRSIEEMRSLITDHEKYTDDEIRKIEATLEGLADLAFDMWLVEKHNKTHDDKKC